MEEFRGHIAAEISSLKEDVAICKAAVSAGVTTASVAPKIKVPEPPKFGGKRDAKELDNFFWLVEQYLDALNVVDDATKIKTTTLYLEHDAILWWRRRHAEMERGLRWAEQELKRRGVQDLASAIAVAESLVEFSKGQAKKEKPKKGNYGKGGGDKPTRQASLLSQRRSSKGKELARIGLGRRTTAFSVAGLIGCESAPLGPS
ncbi:hypothetical protein GH714_043996 [Hevea brasiliensis]|uniref:Retrotransposon gag domain-containing protein n=1 Tax=Hevea brasiliensis TaxID=3981 RepID=A0A6A6K2F6_HEVBR|nr:hypothetical protein GH714_043996 [Hevea brasiliensis]